MAMLQDLDLEKADSDDGGSVAYGDPFRDIVPSCSSDDLASIDCSVDSRSDTLSTPSLGSWSFSNSLSSRSYSHTPDGPLSRNPSGHLARNLSTEMGLRRQSRGSGSSSTNPFIREDDR